MRTLERSQKIYCKCPDCDQEHTEKEAEQVCDCGCIRCRIIFDAEDYKLD